jgi:hypothetical protein
VITSVSSCRPELLDSLSISSPTRCMLDLPSLSLEVPYCESLNMIWNAAESRYRSPVGIALSALVWVVYTSAIQLEGYVHLRCVLQKLIADHSPT